MKLSYEIKTGVLVLTGIILFIIGFSYLKSNDVFIKDRVFYAVYEDVEGVSKGTPVTISGFNVGSVQDIKFFNNSSKLLLKFRVENDFNFSNQSTAQIYETGLIGGKALAVIPKYGNEIAKSGDTLNSSIAPGLTELVNDKLSPLQEKIESMVVSADSVLISLNSVLNTQAKDQIQSTITNFSSTVTDLKNSAGTLDEMISMNKNKINNIITNVNKSSNELSDLSNSFSDLTVIIENLSESSNSIENIVNEISSGNGSLGNLIYDDNLIKSLNAASSNINLLIEDLRLNPKRYVHFSLFGKKNKPYNKEEE
ncbi:MAG: MCE family protein [Cryomorphaceae bacterium]|nr:MAG: MCE family protein [Cryomorphaceae bacterium]